MEKYIISQEDRIILRELAKKQLEYSHLPIMQERTDQWYRHNDLKGEKPMIHIEFWTFAQDILPELKCHTEIGQAIERGFHTNFLNYEMIGDDRVVPPYYSVSWSTWFQLFGVTIESEHVQDTKGRNLGPRFKYVIDDLEKDLPKLGPTKYGVDREGTTAWKEFLEGVFGDILPVKLTRGSLYAVPTQDAVHMMGMENMLFAMYDCPDAFHAFMKRITDDYAAYFLWLQKEGLLVPTVGPEGCGQGTFCFTHELPQGIDSGKGLTTKDVWGYMDSQESVGISPDMYREFIFPYYKKISDLYELFSYGCCEPVHDIWDQCLSKCENLRKVSISPWCEEEIMGEKLRGSKVIYHRKPNPNYLGVGRELDEDAWREHIEKTLRAARGCHLEITQRDVYSLDGNVEKVRRAVQIVRELIEEHWK